MLRAGTRYWSQLSIDNVIPSSIAYAARFVFFSQSKYLATHRRIKLLLNSPKRGRRSGTSFSQIQLRCLIKAVQLEDLSSNPGLIPDS